ncbi:MAG: hypothetical protein OXU81_15965 [Gammaproteobacteria bacterium]|nr:hypothetical protein [Gammaproteobacteria bacterium]
MNRGYVLTPLAEADLDAVRLRDLARIYAILDRPEQGVGGARRLSSTDGRMDWPTRGVYFFFEPGEVRTDSGNGPRGVRVGTHALTARSRTTLWNRLSNHRGTAATGGGNHRGSIFRLLVGTALMHRETIDLGRSMFPAGSTS